MKKSLGLNKERDKKIKDIEDAIASLIDFKVSELDMKKDLE